MSRNQYEALRSPQGSLFVGSPGETVEKILYEWDLFHHDRFLLQMSIGDLSHRDAMRAIERFGTKVAPVVRKEIAKRKGETVAEPSAASA
jgi:alkanesulfonate monooxygenase SsuD/methylene tetrahydromethanopterin reductase-like flavin-dependent oxidoreductase (luciferase family)